MPSLSLKYLVFTSSLDSLERQYEVFNLYQLGLGKYILKC